MKYKINHQEYEVVIKKKNNKNTYIRVKDDMKIYVTTHYLASKSYVKNLLDNNIDYLEKMLEKREVQKQKEASFYYLGNKYGRKPVLLYGGSVDSSNVKEITDIDNLSGVVVGNISSDIKEVKKIFNCI